MHFHDPFDSYRTHIFFYQGSWKAEIGSHTPLGWRDQPGSSEHLGYHILAHPLEVQVNYII